MTTALQPAVSLLAVLERGEVLSRDTAIAQARLCRSAQMRRALVEQARQEAVHAALCRAALKLCSGATRRRPIAAEDGLERYARMLRADLAAGDLARTLVGLQVVLEALGEVVADRLQPRKLAVGKVFEDALGRVLPVLAAQERSHRALGSRTLEQLIRSGAARADKVQCAAADYLDAADAMLADCDALFELSSAAPAHYRMLLRAKLPTWMQSAHA